MMEAARKRSGIGAPCIRIIIGPAYPDRPRLTEDWLGKQVERPEMQHWAWRRIQQGFISTATPSMTERFEVNFYGLLSYTESLSEKRQSTRSLHLDDIIYTIGRILHRAAFLLQETTMNLPMQVSLEGVSDYAVITEVHHPQPWETNPYRAIEDPVVAEKSFPRETLDQDFRTHVTDLIRQLMWAFDWTDEHTIVPWVAKRVQCEWNR
jgi:hypothetical protein